MPNAGHDRDDRERAAEIFELFEDANRLSHAAQAFHQEKHHLYFSAARSDRIPRYLSDRAHTTGADVLSASEELVGAYARAAARFDEFIRGDDRMMEFPESRRVETAFKGVHMWLRAYQDAACAVLVAARGDRAGGHTSMAKHLAEGKSTRVFLDERLPEYEPWFGEWRDRRNEMKVGASFRLLIDGEPPRLRGLTFEYPRGRSAASVREGFISLDDVVAGLDMSRRLTEVVRAAVEADAPN